MNAPIFHTPSPRYSEAFDWIISESPDATESTRDETLRQIAAHLRDHFGVLPAEAVELMTTWGQMAECEPPPQPAEIAQIVKQAFSAHDCDQQNSKPYSPPARYEFPIADSAIDTPTKPKTKKEWALSHAGAGLNVFPLRRNDKRPLIEGWQIAATANETQIIEWWTKWPDANIAIATGRNHGGLTVIDVDPRNGGTETLAQLREVEEFPPTLSAKTQSGGVHHYFRSNETALKSRANALGPGVDIKSAGGYVVAPGSTVDGRSYEWVAPNTPIAAIPQWVVAKSTAPMPRSAAAGKRLVPEDNDAITTGEAFIATAPEAFEGERDNTAFKVAARLYDFGVSKETAVELLTEWNYSKCNPPLDDHDIERICHSASKNRANPIGVSHPANNGVFEPVEIDESKKPAAVICEPYKKDGGSEPVNDRPFVSLATPFSFPDPADIPPVPWVVEGVASRGDVTTTTGPGGVSKSTWALHVAVAVATGRSDICGFTIPRRERVWVWGQEDTIDVMNARVLAIMQEFGVTRADLEDEDGRPMLLINSGRGRGKRLTLVERRGDFLRPTEDLDRVVETALHEKTGLLMFEPLVSLHQAAENVNEQMRTVFDHLGDIAVDAKAAFHLFCHTGKPDKASSEGFAGDAYAIRGGSAQPDAARVATTFMGMSKADLKHWTLPDGHSHNEYVRIDEAKSNLGPMCPEPHWYRRERIIVPGYRGGRLPVLKPIEPEPKGASAKTDNIAGQLARAIHDHLSPDTWLPISALVPHLPDRLAAALNDTNNRTRPLNQAFGAGTNQVMTDLGILNRQMSRGRLGTQIMLSPNPSIPQIPQKRIDE